MIKENRHRALLRFVQKVIDVPANYSVQELLQFRSACVKSYPEVVPLIDAYLRIAESAATNVEPSERVRVKLPRSRVDSSMHLFDMLRDKRLFPSNSDLSEFAGRVLPGIRSARFDKMSRGDIAGKIIEHLETKDNSTRRELEASMREAMESGSKKVQDRKSFFSKWEKIIKGIEL